MVNAWEGKCGARRLIADPAFVKSQTIADDLLTIELRKTEVKLFKPLYLGQIILDLSKNHMYDFFYSVLKKELNDLHLLYMDTDSFIFSCSSDVYGLVSKFPSRFDTSNFPSPPNPFGITPQNKKVLGLFKDECAGDALVEFVGLRPKMYAFSTLSNQTSCRAKGVGRSVVKNYSLSDYKACFFGVDETSGDVAANTLRYDLQTLIRSKSHQIFTLQINKQSLRAFDDKRFWIDNLQSLPWGHVRIPRTEDDEESSSLG